MALISVIVGKERPVGRRFFARAYSIVTAFSRALGAERCDTGPVAIRGQAMVVKVPEA
jgi:hypothetical protein